VGSLLLRATSHVSMSTSSVAPFDPAGPVLTTRVANVNDRKLNQYVKVQALFNSPQTHVTVCKDLNRSDKKVVGLFCIHFCLHADGIQVVKAVKRRNATRDKFHMLRRNAQARKGVPLSTEQSILREIAIMKCCRHANLVKILEVIDDPRREKIYIGLYSFVLL
jgi:hypothetical protein